MTNSRTEHNKLVMENYIELRKNINNNINIQLIKEFNSSAMEDMLKFMEDCKNGKNIGLEGIFNYFYSKIQQIRYGCNKLNYETLKCFVDLLKQFYKFTGYENFYYFAEDILFDAIELRHRDVEYPEKEIQKNVINNFNRIFPNYTKKNRNIKLIKII